MISEVLDRPSAFEIKFLLMATGIAMIPKPVPPVVTRSPDVFLSLAIPETG